MNDMAKSARAAMKAKAKKLTTDPHEKVDSSDWTPSEPLNTEAKTGMRPISRRQFKAGGKVEGKKEHQHAGRKPRKSGGKALTASSLINRDVKEANKLRGGEQHIGGMKRGGKIKREHHADGNPVGKDNLGRSWFQQGIDRLRDNVGLDSPDYAPKTTGKSSYNQPSDSDREALAKMSKDASEGKKRGGRAKKFLGGPMMQPGNMMSSAPSLNVANTQGMPAGMNQDPRQGIVDKNRLNFGTGTSGSPYKKGGKVAHEDVKEDKALIRKMVKPSARTGKKEGGGKFSKEDMATMDRAAPALQARAAEDKLRQVRLDRVADTSDTFASKYTEPHDNPKMTYPGAGLKKGGRAEHCWGGEAKPKKRKEGGGVFSGPSYPGKVPGVVPGGRMARKSGGKAMTVNVIVAGKDKQPGMVPPAGMMPPGGPPPGARPPVSVPPPQPLTPAAGAPAPMQPPMPMQQPPMGRKHGGRTFHSYKDMTAGSASGEGRLEKSDIAAYKKRK